MPTKCETASLTAAPRDGGYHDHNADQLSHSPFLSAASWDLLPRIVSRAHRVTPQPLDLAQEFGDAVQRDLSRVSGLSDAYSPV